MKKESSALEAEKKAEDITVPAFGHELIREVLLEDLLGPDSRPVLYWAGRKLARKFPLGSTDEIIEFFRSAGWGTLTINKEGKNEMTMALYGPEVERRLSVNGTAHFQLEAGFIAEQIQSQQRFRAEAAEELKRRAARTEFTVKLDIKDPID